MKDYLKELSNNFIKDAAKLEKKFIKLQVRNLILVPQNNLEKFYL